MDGKARFAVVNRGNLAINKPINGSMHEVSEFRARSGKDVKDKVKKMRDSSDSNDPCVL